MCGTRCRGLRCPPGMVLTAQFPHSLHPRSWKGACAAQKTPIPPNSSIQPWNQTSQKEGYPLSAPKTRGFNSSADLGGGLASTFLSQVGLGQGRGDSRALPGARTRGQSPCKDTELTTVPPQGKRGRETAMSQSAHHHLPHTGCPLPARAGVTLRWLSDPPGGFWGAAS